MHETIHFLPTLLRRADGTLSPLPLGVVTDGSSDQSSSGKHHTMDA
jgi:hypothetical protein